MCTTIDIRGYHGTDRSCYDNLEINKEFPVNKLPSDLGNGLYLFIDRKNKSSPDSCVKCYTMFLPFLLIKIDVF
ncbi:hypothetical protein P7991_14645, partial [Staphylococcus aureus]|nr:hypothetical protein [Staphylococcus aureus]